MDIQYAQSGIFTPTDFAFPVNGVRAEATPNSEMTVVADVDLELLKEMESTVETNTVVWLDNEYAQLHYHANDMIKNHQNKFKGWTCNAGIESLMINWDGDVHRATCRVGGSLGNIYEGMFVAPSEPVRCDRNFCTCAADIPLTKENKNETKSISN